jgi:putative nucleotidyltransferase with HDIG domain
MNKPLTSPKPSDRQKENKVFAEALRMLVTMIDQKGNYIWGHAERVAGNCAQFARTLGLSKGDVDRIYLAGLLHDIGMIYVPLAIINKPERLSPEEVQEMRRHPLIAEKILVPMTLLKDIVPIVRHHHELYDGSGYPDGLAGDAIPVGSRILGLIDCYEALIAPRAHRKAMSVQDALEHVSASAGKLFDPEFAGSFVAFIRKTPHIVDEIHKETKTIQMRQAVLDIAAKLKRGELEMPVLPKVVANIQRVINDPNATLDDIARLIEQDAVISVKMITVCNSSVYRGAETITSIRKAVTRMGIQQVNSIVTALAARSLYRTANRQFLSLMEKLWLHSLATAYCARAVAEKLFPQDIEKFFLMGLLHDIGITVLIKAIEAAVPGADAYPEEAIMHTIHAQHAGVGAALLERWKFPRDFWRIAEQHESQALYPTTPPDVLVIHMADKLAGCIGYPMFDEDRREIWEYESPSLLNMKPDTMLGITDATAEIMKNGARIF